MSAYLTSGIGGLSFAPLATAFSDAPSAGLVGDGVSRMLDADVDLDGIEGALVEHFGAGLVRRMSRDVITFGTRPVRVIQRLPSEDEEPVLDFTRLTDLGVGAKPVVMYRPGFKSRDVSFSGWIEALKAFGHDIRVVNRHHQFEKTLIDLRPDIVCFSALEYEIPHLAEAWRSLMRLSPASVSILGGYAALPSATNFFDVVVPGEGDIILPLLLRFFHGSIAGKVLKRERTSPEAAKPWQLGAGTVSSLFDLTARRIWGTSEGELGSVPIDIGSALYVGHAVEGDPLEAAYRQPRTTWPIPVGSVELETLWRLPPEGEIRSRHACIYVQRGCKPDPRDRCSICTITSPSGRHMSPARVVDVLKELHSRGVRIVALGDDNFIQSGKWIGEFLDLYERASFDEPFIVYFQTRADRWEEDVVTRMWDLGMRIETGLETMNPVRAERMGKVRKGRGRAYVDRGKRLIELAARYAREKGISTSDILRLYMITAGYGDSLEDVLADVEEQLSFEVELRRKGLAPPASSYNLRQHIHTRDPITEKIIDPARLEVTRVGYDGRRADPSGTMSVDLGEVSAIFYPFFFRTTGEAEGMMHPLSFRTDDLMSSFLLLLHYNVYGEDDPSSFPKPPSRQVHEAAISALRDMIGVLESHYGSRERAEDLVSRLAALYNAAYGESADAS